MNIDGFITAESQSKYKQIRDEYVQKYGPLLNTYRMDYTATIQAFPCLGTWLRSLDDCNWQVAADTTLWKQLAADGFLLKLGTPKADVGSTNAKHRMQLVNPRVLDAFHAQQGRSVNYAFNEMRVCVQKNTAIPPTVRVPAAWRNVCMVDTEIFDLPPEFVGDLFDDREKIHAVYLVGRDGDTLRHKAIYIGISSGEPYGAGPRQRESSGRFRFYRFDVKDKWHCEYLKLTTSPEWAQRDVATLPDRTTVGENEATLLYGRGYSDASHVCLSDPLIKPVWEGWIATHPHNHLVFRTVAVERIHEELKEPPCPNTPFTADSPSAALTYALENYRHLYVATFHPDRLIAASGLDLYFVELPKYRQDEYSIYEIERNVFGSYQGALPERLTIPAVMADLALTAWLMKHCKEQFEHCAKWLTNGVVADLYAFGHHPEHRLVPSILLWKKLDEIGWWRTAIETAYAGHLFDLTHPLDGILTSHPEARVNAL